MTEPPRPTDPPPVPPPGENPADRPTSGSPPPPPPPPPPQGGYPGGYPPPPPGGNYPPPGFPPGFPPPGYPTADDKTWALLAHFGGAAGALVSWGVLGWVAPLIAMLAKGPQSPTVRAHAVAALNFQLLWSILSLISVVFGACLFWLVLPLVLFLVPIIPIVFGFIGGIRANEGVLYRYPMSVTFVR